MSGDVFQASRSERAVGYVAIAWCLSFAAVSLWQLVTGLPTGNQFAAYASGLAAMVVVVLLLKVVGALVVFAAVHAAEGANNPVTVPAVMTRLPAE